MWVIYGPTMKPATPYHETNNIHHESSNIYHETNNVYHETSNVKCIILH